MSLNQRLRSSKDSRARGQNPASHTLCAEMAFEALNRGPRRARHLPWDRPSLPVTPEQGQLFAFCFSLASNLLEKHPNPRSEGPRPRSTCSERAGSQASRGGSSLPLPQGPRDWAGFPQWAVGHVPTLRAAFWGGRGPSSGPAKAGLLEDARWALRPVREEWGLQGFGSGE